MTKNNLTTQGPRELSNDLATSLISGITESRSSSPIVGGTPILRLLKSGNWVFGQGDDPVQEGSEWAVNPLSIQHGYSCWSDNPGNQKNELLGEAMVSIGQRKPARPEPINGFGWAEQRVFNLKCMNGDDEGTEVVYKTSSVGGMRAVDSFLAKLVAQLGTDKAHPVAIVQLDVDSYQHTKWGETFVPIIEVVGWATMEGALDGGDEAAPQAAKKAPPAPAKAAKASKTPLKDAVNATIAAGRPGAAPRRQRPAARA